MLSQRVYFCHLLTNSESLKSKMLNTCLTHLREPMLSALGCTQILILDKAASKRVCGSLLTHKASESRFNEVKSTKEQKTFMLWKRIVAMLHMRL